MYGTRSGGSALAPGPAAMHRMQPSAAERTANVQAVGTAVPMAHRIPLPKASELTQLDIKVPSVNLVGGTLHICVMRMPSCGRQSIA